MKCKGVCVWEGGETTSGGCGARDGHTNTHKHKHTKKKNKKMVKKSKPERKEYKYCLKDMYKNVHTFIHSKPHLEKTQISMKRTDKLWNTTQHKNKWATNIHNNMVNLRQKT